MSNIHIENLVNFVQPNKKSSELKRALEAKPFKCAHFSNLTKCTAFYLVMRSLAGTLARKIGTHSNHLIDWLSNGS